MAIVLKKASVRAPAPLVEPRTPAAPPVDAPSAAPKRHPADAWQDRPESPTLEHWQQNMSTHRPARPRPCTLCGKEYPYPCDGAKGTRCLTAAWIRAEKA